MSAVRKSRPVPFVGGPLDGQELEILEGVETLQVPMALAPEITRPPSPEEEAEFLVLRSALRARRGLLALGLPIHDPVEVDYLEAVWERLAELEPLVTITPAGVRIGFAQYGRAMAVTRGGFRECFILEAEPEWGPRARAG